MTLEILLARTRHGFLRGVPHPAFSGPHLGRTLFSRPWTRQSQIFFSLGVSSGSKILKLLRGTYRGTIASSSTYHTRKYLFFSVHTAVVPFFILFSSRAFLLLLFFSVRAIFSATLQMIKESLGGAKRTRQDKIQLRTLIAQH